MKRIFSFIAVILLTMSISMAKSIEDVDYSDWHASFVPLEETLSLLEDYEIGRDVYENMTLIADAATNDYIYCTCEVLDGLNALVIVYNAGNDAHVRVYSAGALNALKRYHDHDIGVVDMMMTVMLGSDWERRVAE